MTIYIDEVFAVNVLMDWVMLWSAGKLGKLNYNKKSLFWAAVVGGLYAVVIFFPIGQWFSQLWGKGICSILMLLIAYKPKTIKGLVKAMVYLYLVAFAMGGAVIGGMYFFGQPFVETWSGIALVQVDFQIIWLFCGIVMAVFLALWIQKPLHRDIYQNPVIIQMNIVLNEKKVSVNALVDTGNQLIDPISQSAVVVVEYQSIKELLPEQLCRSLNQVPLPSIDALILSIADDPLRYRMRMIPYHSIGNSQGMLLGMRPDHVEIIHNHCDWVRQDVIIALYHGVFSSYGKYQALAHVDLL